MSGAMKKPLLTAGLALLVLYVVGCGLAAWLLPAGESTLTAKSVFLGLVPDRSLPLSIDPEALSPAGTVQVGTTPPATAPHSVFIKAPQSAVCPYLQIRVDDGKRAIELIPALEPDARDASGSLALSDGDRFACSLVVTIDGNDRPLPRGQTLRLAFDAERPGTPLFEPKVVASVRGLATTVSGALDQANPGSARAMGVEIASPRILLQSVVPTWGESPGLKVVMDTDRPTRLALAGDDRSVRWFLRRWLRFVLTGKGVFELVSKGLPGG
jgi:hypothetical protein